MESQGLVPNEWTYNAKVKVHSSVGDFKAALDTVQQMQANGVMPGRATWDVIVSMAELMDRSDIVQQVALRILFSRVSACICIALVCFCYTILLYYCTILYYMHMSPRMSHFLTCRLLCCLIL